MTQPDDHSAEKDAPWRPDDHPPHSWPIGNPAGWRDGYGCPTIECKGEGARRVTPPGKGD